MYSKPKLKSFSKKELIETIGPAQAQSTGSLTITFQQTVQLERPAYEIQLADKAESIQKIIKHS